MKTIGAREFKATCLKLMDRTQRKPARSIFGAAKHRFLYLAPDEEILSTGEVWDAER